MYHSKKPIAWRGSFGTRRSFKATSLLWSSTSNHGIPRVCNLAFPLFSVRLGNYIPPKVKEMSTLKKKWSHFLKRKWKKSSNQHFFKGYVSFGGSGFLGQFVEIEKATTWTLNQLISPPYGCPKCVYCRWWTPRKLTNSLKKSEVGRWFISFEEMAPFWGDMLISC